jgi:hypothetical protein
LLQLDTPKDVMGLDQRQTCANPRALTKQQVIAVESA